MSVDLTPRGTRGLKMPRLPRPLMKALQAFISFRVRRGGGRLLNLTTVGARSGKEHTVPLSCFPVEGGAWLVVASYGGAVQHPAWYVNMARNPDQVWIDLGQGRHRVRPESLGGAERAAAWRRLVAVAPVYAGYQERTDREIPVVRLTPLP